jgi:hypothetical protein
LRLLIADQVNLFQSGVNDLGLAAVQLFRRGHALTINVKVTDLLEQFILHGEEINCVSAFHL